MSNKITLQENNPNLIAVTPLVCAEITEYKGKRYVDIRKWWLTDAGTFARTSKGISLSVEDAELLAGILPEIIAKARG